MDRKNMLKLGITAVVLAFMGGLATSAQHMTMDDARTQDQNWSELMKSMKAMHAAMGTAQPSGNDDEDFVNLMLPHHEAAVEMAKAELFHGNDPQMRRLEESAPAAVFRFTEGEIACALLSVLLSGSSLSLQLWSRFRLHLPSRFRGGSRILRFRPMTASTLRIRPPIPSR